MRLLLSFLLAWSEFHLAFVEMCGAAISVPATFMNCCNISFWSRNSCGFVLFCCLKRNLGMFGGSVWSNIVDLSRY